MKDEYISSSLLEEVGPLKSYVFGLALFCILPLTVICGPRRWSTSCKNQWSVSKYVIIIKNLGRWNTDGVICCKNVNRTSGSI